MSTNISPEHKEQIAGKLNVLLANLHIFYQNSRGFHWNIRGKKFFELHQKYEELYTDLFEKVDEVAERILTLGYEPIYRYEEAAQKSTIKTATETRDSTETARQVAESLAFLIGLEREILAISGEADDEGTNDLMSSYIREQEKTLWMYQAFLG